MLQMSGIALYLQPLYRGWKLALLLGLGLGVLVAPFAAQPAPPAASSQAVVSQAMPLRDDELSLERIETARKTTEADATLVDPLRQKTLDLYDQARRWLEDARVAQQELSRLDTLILEAPSRLAEIRERLTDPQGLAASYPAVDADAPLQDLEYQVAQEDLALLRAREALKKREAELAQLLVGMKSLGEDIAARARALEEIERDLKTPVPEEPAALTRARTLALKARQQLRQAEVELFTKRLANQNLFTDLAQAERDLAAGEVTLMQSRSEAVKKIAQQRREDRAEQDRKAAEALRARAAGLSPALKGIADDTARYRKELEDLVRAEKAVTERRDAARSGLDELKTDFERTRQRVEVVGPSEAIGRMLRRRRDVLPSIQVYRRSASERRVEISRATDRQIDIEEGQRGLGELNRIVEETLAGLPAQADAEETARLRQETLTLAQARRDALNELQKVYGRYISQLTALDLAERQLSDIGDAYVDYINDQLMWIPSTKSGVIADPERVLQGVFWLLSPGNWLSLLQDLATTLQQRPGPVLLVMVGFVLLRSARRRARQGLQESAQLTRKIRTDSFALTLRALQDTLLLVAGWPLLVVGTGWVLKGLPSATPFSLAVAEALTSAGWVFGGLLLVRQMCIPEGLGDRHLRWSSRVREESLRLLSWLLPLAVGLRFLITLTASNNAPENLQPIGSMAFVLNMAALAYVAWRLLRRGGAVNLDGLERRGFSWLGQLRFLWLPLSLGALVALAVTSLLGYHYTALHIEYEARQMIWFFVGLVLIKDLLLRWLYVAERRLRFEDAVRRRDELRAQRAREGIAEEHETAPISVEVPEIDFDQLSEQAKRLLHSGFLFGAIVGTWLIWSDLLPALGFLEHTELPITTTAVVDGVTRETPVTLADLAIGLLIGLITMLAAKNLPGVLEILLLQRLPLEQGARYAITTLAQYLIAGAGLIVVFRSIGLQWANIQWLVAALSVGLGFGLQEIVANFISGIILLFERPIRVGDVVTVENTTGVVSRIKIRATTIINWDKQELLVPNKEFITGRLINWTLSDKMNRIVINVGVAYGTDVAKAMEVMFQAAQETEHVLEDPKPVVSFEGFGDNALNLVLRAYLGSLDYRLATITALHQAINRKLLEAGIDIAFPQRDVHLRTSQPLEIRFGGGGDTPGPRLELRP